MSNVLFISPRFPYPPDRGEKIRIWHLLCHIARSHRVFLGCLVDNPDDWRYRPQVEAVCEDFGGFNISARRQKILAAMRIRPGRPLMLDYYDHRQLRRWIAHIAAARTIDVVYIFSTAMLPYALALPEVPRVLDMVDVDSEKWAAYGRKALWPFSLVWAREARTLRKYERRAIRLCDRSLLVTEAERRRFVELAPECGKRVLTVENGVDLEWFVPDPALYLDPYPDGGPWLTLVANMDYWPNSDAAVWFAREILPIVRRNRIAKFAVVGANPGPDVRRLADLPGVVVTGRVADVRPYLAHAAVVVAPLRIARGVQNKVLEGMAMARPVVASSEAFLGIRAQPGRDLLVASGADAIARCVAEVLDGQYQELGNAGRAVVEQNYCWAKQLLPLDQILNAAVHSRTAVLSSPVPPLR
jgi:sugar transferase (PEP-CTERM/EpsH1 system associated)